MTDHCRCFTEEFEPRTRTRSQLSTGYVHSLTVEDRSPSVGSLLSDSVQVAAEDHLVDEPEDRAEDKDYKMIEEEKAETGRVRLYFIHGNTVMQNCPKCCRAIRNIANLWLRRCSVITRLRCSGRCLCYRDVCI